MIAEAFNNQVMYHRVFNLQGLTVLSLSNYGGKLGSDGWAFPDESRGNWREDGNWPDGGQRWRFIAAGAVVVEQEDELV